MLIPNSSIVHHAYVDRLLIERLSNQQLCIAFYIATCERVNPLGLYEISPETIVRVFPSLQNNDNTFLPTEYVENTLRLLTERGIIIYDTNIVFNPYVPNLRNYIRYHQRMLRKVLKQFAHLIDENLNSTNNAVQRFIQRNLTDINLALQDVQAGGKTSASLDEVLSALNTA